MSQATLYLKPARPDVVVRDPANGKPLPPEGAAKPRTLYWQRRLNDGSVIPSTAPQKAAPPKAAPQKTAKE
jgi:hypothetical protein